MMWSSIKILVFIILFCGLIKCPKIDELRASITETDQRAFIKCHILLGDSASVIHSLLQRIARRQTLSLRTVQTLYQQFYGGERLEPGDTGRRPGPGRPKSQTTNINKQKLRELLLEDNSLSITEMATQLDLSYSTAQRLLISIGAKYVATRWVLHDLSTQQKANRVEACQNNLKLFTSTPDLLDRIIAIDESWLRSYDPKDPKSAKQWCLPEQDP